MKTFVHPIFFFLWAIFFFCVTTTQAQETKQYDAVYLKDSTVVYGQIMRYEPTGVLVLQLENGTTVEYPADQVLKTKKEELSIVTAVTIEKIQNKNRLINPLEPTPVKKMYGWGALGNIFSNRFGEPTVGLSLDLGLGHKFHSAFMLGAGLGVTTEYIQTIAYLYGSIRGALLKRSYSPYYQIDIGYGLPLSAASPYALLVEPQAPGPAVFKRHGGLYLHPSIGYRFASVNTVHTYLAAGCLVQFVKYEGRDWNNFDFVETLVFIRPSLRVGIVF